MIRLNKINSLISSFSEVLEEIGLIPKTRKSNPISKLLRPVFESQAIKTVVGSQLAVLTLLTGLLSIPVSAYGVVNIDQSFHPEFDVQVKTDSSLTYPVPEAYGVSQGYNVVHKAIDIRAPLGASIKPIASGTVRLIGNQYSGWGRRIEIDHGSGLVSLYAHLGKIFVDEGQTVSTSTTIAEVGMTGWTTGPHLHLEVYEDEKLVNPVKYLERK